MTWAGTTAAQWLALGALVALGPVAAAGAPAAPARERVVVTLRAQAGLSTVSGSRADRIREVVRRRRARSDADFARFRARIASWRKVGDVGAVTRLWVVNGFVLDATPAVAAALAGDPAVERVVSDEVRLVPAATGAPEWNIGRVGAPSLWGLGASGQGVVVATLDSGVDADHPDLAGRWRGGTNSWFDPFGQHPVVPADLSGHGTAVMGIIVGGDAGGTAIGVAPGARWIAARVFDDQGNSTISSTHQAFQWLLDPDGDPATADAPQVVNASWGFAGGVCNLEFAPDIASLRAAGIVPVFAAGNFGSVNTSPANNPGAFSVGSTTGADAIATDSSRGPATCGGQARTFPDLVAPGVAVTTSDLGGMYAVESGTSLAAPHVAGALALLLGARPGLTVAQQESALRAGAVDLGSPGADNTFGDGRLDIAASYQSVVAPPPPPDTIGPDVSGVAVTPATASTGPVALTAQAVDAAGKIAAAEWFEGLDPGAGAGTPLVAVDGAFDSPTEALTATVDASALAAGSHTLSVRARDTAGNWGTAGTATLVVDRPVSPGPVPSVPVAAGGGHSPALPATTPSRPDLIFADGFTSGDPSRWSTVAGARRLRFVGTGGGMPGMSVRLAGAVGPLTPASAFVGDDSPDAEPVYRARFFFDPNGSRPGGGRSGVALLRAFASDRCTGSGVFAVRYRLTRGSAQVRLTVAGRGGQRSTGWRRVPSGVPTPIEVTWQARPRSIATVRTGRGEPERLTIDALAADRIESVCLGAMGLSDRVRDRAGNIRLGGFVSTRTLPARVGP